MICDVYDDKFDTEYLYQLYMLLETNLKWHANNVANASTIPFGRKGTHKLFGSNIFQRSGVNNIDYCDNENFKSFYSLFQYCSQICNINSESVILSRICANLQHNGCEGTLHIDGSSKERTLMVFPNPEWNPEWGGKFQIFSEDKKEMLEEHEYVPGRIISFPSHLPHRGLAPVGDYLYRYSIVFGIS